MTYDDFATYIGPEAQAVASWTISSRRPVRFRFTSQIAIKLCIAPVPRAKSVSKHNQSSRRRLRLPGCKRLQNNGTDKGALIHQKKFTSQTAQKHNIWQRFFRPSRQSSLSFSPCLHANSAYKITSLLLCLTGSWSPHG